MHPRHPSRACCGSTAIITSPRKGRGEGAESRHPMLSCRAEQNTGSKTWLAAGTYRNFCRRTVGPACCSHLLGHDRLKRLRHRKRDRERQRVQPYIHRQTARRRDGIDCLPTTRLPQRRQSRKPNEGGAFLPKNRGSSGYLAGGPLVQLPIRIHAASLSCACRSVDLILDVDKGRNGPRSQLQYVPFTMEVLLVLGDSVLWAWPAESVYYAGPTADPMPSTNYTYSSVAHG